MNIPRQFGYRAAAMGFIGAAFVLTSPRMQFARAAAASVATPERIAINDNRVAAGTLQEGTLTVRLEARVGEWRPDGEQDPGVEVMAFGVEGQPLQIPGPLLRVTEGTDIRAVVRNGLVAEPLVLHGLYTRRAAQTAAAGAPETVSIPAGDTREIRFQAGAPGTYYYWGATTNVATVDGGRRTRDSQLSGALVVEPRGIVLPPERVLVIGQWNDGIATAGRPNGNRRIVMNGKSWPHTERLTYQVGDSVRMRLVNTASTVHPMHLHGFYFNVDSRGDESVDTVFPPTASPHLVNTERLAPGRTFSLTWKPTRPGNWLFHCHDNLHILRDQPLDGRPHPPAASHHTVNHALEMMGGPVIGISVLPKNGAPAARASAPRRQLRLVARVDSGGTEAEPSFGFVLEDGASRTPAAAPYLPGPTIVLKRGEPVSITVVNDLPEPTAVHWHGIELDSYYDGVAGFSGEGQRISPPIAPGQSFDARFTPPRAGTFIYHTHIDEVRQQQAGLSGALLVLDSPAAYDPQRDLVLLVTVPRLAADAAGVLLNGSSTPAPREMRVGQPYRLRFINVHTARPSMRMRVVRDTELLTWRSLAKDGMDLPTDQIVTGPSAIQMGNGETYDFEFVPAAAGEIRLEVTNNVGDLLVSMNINVR